MIFNNDDIINGLDSYRTKLGLSIEDFIVKCGIGTRDTYQKLLSRQTKSVKAEYLLLFFENTGVKPSEFLKQLEKKHRSYNEGGIIKEKDIAEDQDENLLKDKFIPYWDLPISAGRSIAEIIGKKEPDGYISGLPGAEYAENILPVSGTSMEPEITSGAIIGVKKINNWETLNTERIYLIITREDRMIKRIQPDEEDDKILWCLSPNYPRFKIFKEDIIEIHRVCFVYNAK